MEKDSKGRCYGTGRRKEATARVWIKPGSGSFIVNGKKVEEYFARSVLQVLVLQPFEKTGRAGMYDVWCTVKGGGLSGQAGGTRKLCAGRSQDAAAHIRRLHLQPCGAQWQRDRCHRIRALRGAQKERSVVCHH